MKKKQTLIKLGLVSLVVALVLSLTIDNTRRIAGIDPPTPPGSPAPAPIEIII